MSTAPRFPYAPFRTMQRTLIRRRLASIDFRLRVELAVLGALVAGFAFWQARVPFDSLQRAGGPQAVALAVLAIWALLAGVGAGLAGVRHARHLRRGPPGPAWLALPVSPHLVARHLAWEARGQAMWVAPVAPAVLAAAVGMVPPWWLGLLGAAFVWMLLESSRAGCAIAWRLVLRSAGARPGPHPIARLLPEAASPAGRAALPAATWRARRPWRALCAKDLLLSRRPTPARSRLWTSLALAALSVSSWFLPVSPTIARLLAFTLALVTAAVFGEWLIALSGEDPFGVLRGLPIGVATVWGARAAWSLVLGGVLVVGHALAARPLSPEALQVFLVWTGGAAVLITLLAANYGITLFPRREAAYRMYALALGIAMLVSWILPLMGWVVLLTALVHSARRLGRWTRSEAC